MRIPRVEAQSIPSLQLERPLSAPVGESLGAVGVVEPVELLHVKDEEVDWNILLSIEVNLEPISACSVDQEVVVHEADGVIWEVRSRTHFRETQQECARLAVEV